MGLFDSRSSRSSYSGGYKTSLFSSTQSSAFNSKSASVRNSIAIVGDDPATSARPHSSLALFRPYSRSSKPSVAEDQSTLRSTRRDCDGEPPVFANTAQMSQRQRDSKSSSSPFKIWFSKRERRQRRPDTALGMSSSQQHSLSGWRPPWRTEESEPCTFVISEPMNFQHIVHAKPQNFTKIATQTASDLVADFSVMRASQTTRDLRGIKAESLHERKASSDDSTYPSSTPSLASDSSSTSVRSPPNTTPPSPSSSRTLRSKGSFSQPFLYGYGTLYPNARSLSSSRNLHHPSGSDALACSPCASRLEVPRRARSAMALRPHQELYADPDEETLTVTATVCDDEFIAWHSDSYPGRSQFSTIREYIGPEDEQQMFSRPTATPFEDQKAWSSHGDRTAAVEPAVTTPILNMETTLPYQSLEVDTADAMWSRNPPSGRMDDLDSPLSSWLAESETSSLRSIGSFDELKQRTRNEVGGSAAGASLNQRQSSMSLDTRSTHADSCGSENSQVRAGDCKKSVRFATLPVDKRHPRASLVQANLQALQRDLLELTQRAPKGFLEDGSATESHFESKELNEDLHQNDTKSHKKRPIACLKNVRPASLALAPPMAVDEATGAHYPRRSSSLL